jgi:hypothetical protein
MSKAAPTLLIDNERVRVTEWRFAPGAAIGWHPAFYARGAGVSLRPRFFWQFRAGPVSRLKFLPALPGAA